MIALVNTRRRELIDKILAACSLEEVRLSIDMTISFLEECKIGEYLVLQFINDAVNNLEQFNLVEKTIPQWSNIKMALIHFRNIRRNLEAVNYYKN